MSTREFEAAKVKLKQMRRRIIASADIGEDIITLIVKLTPDDLFVLKTTVHIQSTINLDDFKKIHDND